MWIDGKRELKPKGFAHGVMAYRLTGMDSRYKLSLNPDEISVSDLPTELPTGLVDDEP